MIERGALLSRIREALARSRGVVLCGPRQCGKTTLARELLSPDSVNYFDLEDPASLARLDEPMIALQPLQGLVVIDEVQRRPELFPVLRVLLDRAASPARFLVLGSASGNLLRQSSESLAGRVEYVTLGGFSLPELGAAAASRLWLRGGFPLSCLAANEHDSLAWRRDFIRTLLERDLPQWGVRVSAAALRRFWTMLAHYHGQTWNAAEPARALGVSEPTTRHYLDLLSDTLMVRQLQPWHANLGKRQVKAPKVYVRDSGLLHQLLGIDSDRALLSHPKVGASWEGFAIEQVLATQVHDEAFFWATHQGAEIDLILRRGDRLLGGRMQARRRGPHDHLAAHRDRRSRAGRYRGPVPWAAPLRAVRCRGGGPAVGAGRRAGPVRDQEHPRMTNEQLVSKVWNYAHVLRDRGISCGDYVEQITCCS